MLAAALAAAAVLFGLFWMQRRRTQFLRVQLDRALDQLEQLQRTCSLFAPDGIVQRVAADGSVAAFATPERKEVTIMFADLVGYTAMAERLDPSVTARVVNAYLQRMSDVIHANGGQVAQFLGDGIYAHFGGVRPNPWQSDDAVRTALAMREAMKDYNRELEREGVGPLAISIGIHRGPAVAGMIGTRERMEYAFIGTTVNLASRVESLTRVHHVDVLVTEQVRAQLDRRFRMQAMPAQQVKGIAEPVVTYAVLAFEAAAAPAAAEVPAET